MVDVPETDTAPETDAAPAGGPSRRRRGRLDRRSVAISATIATAAALLAALIVVLVTRDDGSAASARPDGMSLTAATSVDAERLAATALTTPEGQPTTLAALVRGGPAVVNFFQSSCAPCIDEMPLFEAAAAHHPDVRVVGIATQDQADKASALVERTKVTYSWALDPKGVAWYEAKAAGMPATVLLGRDGTVVAAKTGAFTSQDQLDRFIAKAED